MTNLLQTLKHVPSRILIVVLPFLLMGMVEYLERGSYEELHKWVMSHPLSMVLAYFVVGTMYLFLIALTGRSRLSFWILCAILLPLGAISGSKLKAIGAPYYPWDLVFTLGPREHLQPRALGQPTRERGAGEGLAAGAQLRPVAVGQRAERSASPRPRRAQARAVSSSIPCSVAATSSALARRSARAGSARRSSAAPRRGGR